MLGLILAVIIIVFGIANMIHPMAMDVFQMACPKAGFFGCRPPLELDASEGRVRGLALFIAGLLLAALSWRSRK